MPTEPVEHLLDRNAAKDISKIIAIVSPLMREVINYATHVFDNCQTSQKGAKEEAFPLLALYVHLIQMADSIEVLVSNGCGQPASLLLRSSFEAKLSIEYILERDTDKRSIAWLFKCYEDELDYLEKMDPSNPKGKDFREVFENDNIGKIGDPPSVPGVAESIAKLRATLSRPGYAGVSTEYEKRKARAKRSPEWYSIFDGPRNLKQLAEHLHQRALYETLYRSWSRASHAHETSHLFPIRNPLQTVEIASMSVSHLLETTNLMLSEFQSNRLTHFQKWLRREIAPRQTTLIRLELGQLAFIEEQLDHQNKV